MGVYEQIKAQVVPGLDEALEAVLRQHVGEEDAIGRAALVAEVSRMVGERVNERRVREAVRELRRAGMPICSVPGKGGGYFWARDVTELEQFLMREYLAKAEDMEETVRAMRVGAQRFLGVGLSRAGKPRRRGWVPQAGENVWARAGARGWLACRVEQTRLKAAGTEVKVRPLGGGGAFWVRLNEVKVWE